MTAAVVYQKLDNDTLFQKNWEIYQTIVRENYNQHKVLYAKVLEYLASHFSVKSFGFNVVYCIIVYYRLYFLFLIWVVAMSTIFPSYYQTTIFGPRFLIILVSIYPKRLCASEKRILNK